MPVTTSYPGVYIEELPSTTHTVSAAPTSITVFIGFTNPFWQLAPKATPPPFGVATRLFSFADYQANFGGFFSSPWLRDDMGQAVFEFFQNGGAEAYVVALQAGNYFDRRRRRPRTTRARPSRPRRPCSARTPKLHVHRAAAGRAGGHTAGRADDAADHQQPHQGSRRRRHRGRHHRVRLDGRDLSAAPDHRLLATYARSGLAVVSKKGTPPAAYTGLAGTTQFTYRPSRPWAGIVNPLAYTPVFAANASLDKVPSST